MYLVLNSVYIYIHMSIVPAVREDSEDDVTSSLSSIISSIINRYDDELLFVHI